MFLAPFAGAVTFFSLASLFVFKQVLRGMDGMGFFSVTEQVVRHLEAELRRGRWVGVMPGRDRLVAELGVSGKTVELAVKRLEGLGLLEGGGAGHRRRIVTQPQGGVGQVLRVAILLYDSGDRMLAYIHDLQHGLRDAGHDAFLATKTLVEMGRDLARVTAFVEANEADAWVVFGGNRDILKWFAARPVPVFALFGRRRRVSLAGAGPDKVPTMREVVRRLTELGHRRVVLLAREERRKPRPGAVEQAFLDELACHGVQVGKFNLPDWNETPEGYLECLDGLFSLTPPTALIFDEVFLFIVAQQHLARRGMLAPDQISMVVSDPDPLFEWMRPKVAHIRWDPQPVVRRIVRWAGNVARGKDDRRQTFTKAEFVVGGTVGPVNPKTGSILNRK